MNMNMVGSRHWYLHGINLVGEDATLRHWVRVRVRMRVKVRLRLRLRLRERGRVHMSVCM